MNFSDVTLIYIYICVCLYGGGGPDSKSVCHVLNDNPKGGRIRGRPKNRCWNNIQRDINNAKLKSGKRGQNKS